MRIKTFLLAILMVMAAGQGWATNYYACQAAQNLTGDATWCTAAQVSGSCAAIAARTAWATVVADSPTLYANGCTVVVNDSFTAVGLSTADGDAGGAAVAGGSFTLDLATVTAKTLTTAITAGTTDCLVVSGAAGAGTVLTITGALTGSSTTNGMDAVSDTHTGATSVIVVNGDITGGSNSSACGYNGTGTTGYFTFTGNALGVGGTGILLTTATTGSTITGNCTGSSTAVGGVGCSSNGAGGLTIIGTGNTVGNIVDGARAVGVSGSIGWTPHAANYRQTTFGTDVFASAAPTKADIKVGTYSVISTTGAYENGTLAAGGGGAWAQ
jgi:hypothetical protein